MKQINKLRIHFVLLFCIISSIIFILLNYFKNQTIQNYLNQSTSTYLNSFYTINDQLKKLSYIIYTGIEHTTNLKQQLYDYKQKTSSDILTLKKELIKSIQPRYNILKTQNIKSINIVLWDDTLLLSMKHPQIIKQKVSEKRQMIQKVTKTKQYISGYEIGKYGEGFRFIYPVLYNDGQYLGVVEVVFDSSAITNAIMEQYNVLSNFFIQSNQMDKKFLEKTQEYSNSHYKGFVFNHHVLQKIKEISKQDIKKLCPSQQTTNIIYKNFFLPTPSSHYDKILQSTFITIPILHPLTNTMKAVLTVKSDGSKIYQSMQYYNIFIILSIGSIFILFIALYMRYTSNLKNKETLLEIQQLQERFELAMETTKDGIWDWNLKSKEVYYSTTWKKMLGYEEDELTNNLNEWKKRIHTEDIKQTFKDLETHLQKKTDFYENIHRLQHKKGHWIWVLHRGKALFNAEGKAYRMIGFQTDITKQKQLELDALNKERQLFNQDKMAQIGEMIGNIAHQWRQPLSVIATLATGMKLKKEFATLSDETLLKNCDLINDNAQYLSETIDTFRDFIKEQKELKEFILQERIQDILKILEATLTNHFITLFNETKDTKPITLFLIASELDQVIINIINNAKDALLENNIANGWIRLNLICNDDDVTITIEDNAGGIPKKVLPKIFDPYFTTKHQSQGTGLGLHMCYKIVHNSFKGKLSVQNTTNGAKFFIKIPLKS